MNRFRSFEQLVVPRYVLEELVKAIEEPLADGYCYACNKHTHEVDDDCAYVVAKRLL